MTYSEKLTDPRWQRKRLEILNRDNFSCQLCGSDKYTLHVHHKSYNGDPWETANSELITLCEDCHFFIEEIGDGFKLKKAIRSNFGGGMIYFIAFENKAEKKGIFIAYRDPNLKLEMIVEPEYEFVKELMKL